MIDMSLRPCPTDAFLAEWRSHVFYSGVRVFLLDADTRPKRHGDWQIYGGDDAAWADGLRGPAFSVRSVRAAELRVDFHTAAVRDYGTRLLFRQPNGGRLIWRRPKGARTDVRRWRAWGPAGEVTDSRSLDRRFPTELLVPALGHLDPEDPTTLLDGSRRVDALALVETLRARGLVQ